jgi:uncharacterized protein
MSGTGRNTASPWWSPERWPGLNLLHEIVRSGLPGLMPLRGRLLRARLDPVPACLPTTNRLAQLASPPKHHLADPAFAARLLDVNVAEARVSHLRTHRGDHEIDLIVERDGGALAIEVKLTQVPSERDVQHLRWLEGQLGDQVLDSVIITTTGPEAYRRPDGIAVIPAALLGP